MHHPEKWNWTLITTGDVGVGLVIVLFSSYKNWSVGITGDF